MIELLFKWITENVFESIHHSHEIFWNGNTFLFAIYVVSLVLLFHSKEEKTRGYRLFAAFSLIVVSVICYNPLVYNLFLRMPESDDAVYGRVWILLPVWMVIALAWAGLIERIKPFFVKSILNCSIALTIILVGVSSNGLGYYIDSSSMYKINSEGIEIAEEVMSISNGNLDGLLLFCSARDVADKYMLGGTEYEGIKQYTGKIGIYPTYFTEQTWNECFLSETLPDGETTSVEYINDLILLYRRYYDFSYVVMPKDYSLRDKMSVCGYQYVSSVNNSDIYVAIPRWWVKTFSNLMENGKKIYVLADNMGHFIVVGGGNKYDRRQLQQVLYYCGYHVDAWIIPNPSAEGLEGFNYIVSTEGYEVDSVYIPAIDIDKLTDDFWSVNDAEVYKAFLSYSNAGLFNLYSLNEGDTLELFGMSFQVLSDMLDIKTGNATDNSMLFRLVAGSKSFLFCTNIGYHQGQIALKKYGDLLNSNYVQIASGEGDGLGEEFYEAVCPDVAFCDSICDNAGMQTYDMLSSWGITCYCIEKNDPTVVMLE